MPTDNIDANNKMLGIAELKTIVDQSQFLIWRANTSALFDYVNSTWLSFTGRSFEQELGNGWIGNVYPHDLNRYLEVYQSHFKRQLPFEMEYRLRRHDGEYRWVIDKGVPYFDLNGKFNGYIGSCCDISETRVKQERLNALSIVARETENLVIITDKDGKVEWVNDSFTRITEFSLQESFGRKPGEFLQGKETDPKDVVAIRKKLNTLQPFTHDIFNYTKSGRGYWLHLSITPIFEDDGKLHKFVAIQSDITAQKNRELELIKAREDASENELKLRQAQSLAKLGGWEFDLSTGLFLFNDNFYEIFRSSVEKVGGYYVSVDEYASRFIHPEDRSIVQEELNKSIKTTDPDFSNYLEHKIIYEDGEIGHVAVKYFVNKNEDGKTVKIYGVNQDITERKLVEKALLTQKQKLEESQNRLMLASKSAQLGIWDWDIKKDTLIWDERMYELYGLNKSDEDISFNFWSQRLHPDDKEKVINNITIALKSKKSFEATFRVIQINGDIIHIKANALVLRDLDGNASRMIGINRDFTKILQNEKELIRAKEQAEENELKLLEAQALSHVGNWEYIAETDTVTWSKELFNIFERSYELSAPRYSEQRPFYTAESFALLNTAVENCVHREIPYDIELSILTSSGKIKQIISKGQVKKDRNNKTIGCYGTAQDITERKEIEKELIQAKVLAERNEERYRALLTNVEIGIVVHAKDTSIITCNTRSQVLLGLSEDQMRGKVAIDPYWRFVADDGKSILLEDYPVMRVLKTKRTQKNQILGVLKPNLETIWLLVNGFPEFDVNGEIDTITVSFIDITNLQKTVEEKNRLFKELHHRIKNNLQMVSGLMYTKSVLTSDEGLRMFIKETINRVSSIAKVHDRLLQLEEFDKLYTKAYLEELIKIVIDSLAYDSSTYLLEPDIEDHKLSADDILSLGLIVNESISNIIKHAYDAKSGGKILVSFKMQNNEFVLIIKDYGKGFDASNKGYNSLGLIMIDQLSKQLRGTIVRSNKNGSYFELKFPARR